VLRFDGSYEEQYGYQAETTNNRMELTAVIEALRRVTSIPGSPERLEVYTDSQYVRNGITDWIHRWKRNGWKTAGKKPVKNRDLWQTLDELAQALSISWHWVEGHAGVELNERCDELVQQALRQAGSSDTVN
jgi:ribonuclease HI